MTGSVYIGPLGRLMRMDVPIEGFDDPMAELGVLHQPLSGLGTKDVFGYKRVWSIPLDALDARAMSWFRMLYRQAVAGPHYLLDPRFRNRLGPVVSGNAPSYEATPWTPSSGTVTTVAATVALLPFGTLFDPAPSLATAWTPTAAGTLLAGNTPIPVLPGETVTFSCYVQAGTPTVELVPYSAAGIAGTALSGTQTVAGTPSRRYITYVVPSNGSVAAVLPQLRATAAGTYTTLAWQLSDTAIPESWTLGSGVPKVLVSDMSTHAEYLSQRESGSLTLVEV